MALDPDEDLLRGVASGDPGAIRGIITAKLPRLLAVATRMLGDPFEAEDVAQEAFVRIWRHAGRWNWQGARFDTWIHRVTMNLCYDRLRRRRQMPVGVPPDLADDGPMPDAALIPDDRTEQDVRLALRTIAPRQREAIVLVYYQGLSNQEAAAVMRISVDALESLLARGRRSMQASLLKGASND
ncbi:MAG: RNA polymerase sigma factor [Ancalomicrobiaceae bacterium]|nr:RNA polymerase sigma factor [Ancalomicrobiaceae bacterium]